MLKRKKGISQLAWFIIVVIVMLVIGKIIGIW